MDKDDGMVDRLVPAATKEDTGEIVNVVSTNSRSKFFDEHLWLSIAYSPTASAFTRVQRRSCCVALMYTAMIANAMWYDTGSDVKSNILKIGPFTLTVHEVYTGIMSIITVLPSNLLIIFIFRNAKRPVGQEKGTFRGRLPHWALYIAWVLVGLSITASVFFTILYCFEWGREKSQAWLISVILSLLTSTFLVDPMKVN